MLSEMSQTEKDKYCMISLICGILKTKQNRKQTHRKRAQISGYQTQGVEVGRTG